MWWYVIYLVFELSSVNYQPPLHTHTHMHTHTPQYTLAEGLLKVFYNSEFAFSQRLYGSLDIDLPRVLLHQPLSQLVQRSMLYVRGSVSQTCFHALIRLSELAMVSEMADLTRNDLFPTAEAIASLGLQFGMPPEFDMEEGEE